MPSLKFKQVTQWRPSHPNAGLRSFLISKRSSGQSACLHLNFQNSVIQWRPSYSLYCAQNLWHQSAIGQATQRITLHEAAAIWHASFSMSVFSTRYFSAGRLIRLTELRTSGIAAPSVRRATNKRLRFATMLVCSAPVAALASQAWSFPGRALQNSCSTMDAAIRNFKCRRRHLLDKR